MKKKQTGNLFLGTREKKKKRNEGGEREIVVNIIVLWISVSGNGKSNYRAREGVVNGLPRPIL